MRTEKKIESNNRIQKSIKKNVYQKADHEKIQTIIPSLLSWYEENARILPWREKPIPYYVWLSEIMLQQTRVEAVKPYFARFINALPTIPQLAEVEEEKLLKLWEGLGYYNRARNLKKAAQLLVLDFAGKLPASYEELLKLPGIGSYTAGAIASIAFGIPVPAVDGNVLRVISRIIGSREDITKASVKKNMEELLKEEMPKDRAGCFNQALMELGATVCVPNGEPRCIVCPVQRDCKAFQDKTMMQIPVKAAKKARRVEYKTVFLIRLGEKIAIRKRPEKGLLSGLYEFPNIEGNLTEQEAHDFLKEWGIKPTQIQPIISAKHIFSHVEWQMIGYEVISSKEGNQSELIYATGEQLESQYALPSAFVAYSKFLKKLQQNK